MIYLRMLRKKQIPKLTANLILDECVGFSFTNLEKPFWARCEIVAQMGNTAKLFEGYQWNGGDLPVVCWSIFGISPYDPRGVLATGFHDLGCEDDETPQVIADANFCALLGPIEFNGKVLPGVGRWRQTLGYMFVRFYSVFVRPFQKE